MGVPKIGPPPSAGSGAQVTLDPYGDSRDIGQIVDALNKLANRGYGGEVVLGTGDWHPDSGVVWNNLAGVSDNLSIRGFGRGTRVMRQGDFTLFDRSGTSSARRRNCLIRDLRIEDAVTTYLSAAIRDDYTSRCHLDLVTAYGLGGPAWRGRQAWDSYFTRGALTECGARDGSAPAMLVDVVAGDGGNATNNIFLDEFVIESWHTGAVWAEAAAGADKVQHLHFGKVKFERIGLGSRALRFRNVYDLTLGDVQLSVAGALDALFAQGIDLALFRGVTNLAIGKLNVFTGSWTAGDVAALLNFDGTTDANHNLNLGAITCASGSGSGTNKPAAVVRWAGTNTDVVKAKIAWDNNYWNVPAETGAPTSTIAGDLAGYPATNPDYLRNGSTNIRESMTRREGTQVLGTTSGTMYRTAVPLQAGDVITNLAHVVGTTAITFGTAGFAAVMGLYNSAGALVAQTDDFSASGTTLLLRGGGTTNDTLERPITKDGAGAAMASYTVPTTDTYYVAIIVNVGTGGAPAAGNMRGIAFGSGGGAMTTATITGQKKLAVADAGPFTALPANQAFSGSDSSMRYASAR
jgi:hypothetical protein